MRKNLLCTMLLFFLLAPACEITAEQIQTSGRIESVIVYRNRALVTRVVELGNKTGELEILLGDLPKQIDGSSLHASAAPGAEIRSVRYRQRAAEKDPNEDVAEIDRQIKEINDELFQVREMRKLLNAKTNYINNLEQFASFTSKRELSEGVLNAKTISEITNHIFETRENITKEGIRLTKSKQELEKQVKLLQRRRKELAGKIDRTIREGIIFVSKTSTSPLQIQLNYLVNSAGWSPAYNLRLGEDNKGVQLEYLAHVHQRSGEDWDGVVLSLSTATPQMNSVSPLLSPMWINLMAARADSSKPISGPSQIAVITTDQLEDRDAYVKVQKRMRGQQVAQQKAWAVARNGRKIEELGWGLNSFAAGIQTNELNVGVSGEGGFRRLKGTIKGEREEGLAVTYDLPGSVSVASRPDKQLIQITKLDLPCETYYQATPLLTSYVYRLAEITNSSSLPLLAGPYGAYIGGEFVGQGNLKLLARGQKATVGFGVDTQLRCNRELVDKSDTIAWGSRVQNFYYRLRLENFKNQPVNVRLLDRIPASKSDDIKVTLEDMTDKLSSDAVYLRDLKPRGILRWDIQIDASASGEKARDVQYQFEMKFAKDKHIGNFAGSMKEKMREDYEEMLRK